MSQTTVDRGPAPGRTGAPPPHRPPAAGAPGQPSGHERSRVVLETARAVVARGWLQEGWYRTAPRSVWQRLFGPLPTPGTLERACLVAAVAVAGHSGGPFTRIDQDSGPAIDRLWDALQEHRGQPADGPGAVAPVVRRARMRELVRWNDAPGRTRGEVLALLDRAIGATILHQVRAPGAR